MSVLQKVENAYLIIIRLLTVLLMITLMVGAVIVGIYWWRATAEDPATTTQLADGQIPRISVDDIVKHVTEDDEGLNDLVSPMDPNHKIYQQIITTLEDFAKKYSVSDEDADLESFISTLKYKVESQSSAALKIAYLQGLATTLDKGLANPKIVALIRKAMPPGQVQSDSDPDEDDKLQEPMEIVGSLVQQFDAEFSKQISHSASSDANSNSDFEKKRDHANAMLMRWIGPFALFVLILQILIFGKIEQNLRRRRPEEP